MDRLDEYRACIGDYLRQKGINTRKPFTCLCPEHADSHPSMSYNVKAQNVHCFSCGVTYDVFDLVGLDYGLTDFPAKREMVGQLFGITPQQTRSAVHRAAPQAAVEGTAALQMREVPRPEPAPARDAELAVLRSGAGEGLAYFVARGIPEELCRRYGFFEGGGRAVMPVFGADGSCLGWCGRAVSPQVQPRYKNSAGPLPVWLGLPDCKAGQAPAPEAEGPVYVTEGILDAVSLIVCGRRAVALCGSQNTRKLLSLCRENPAALGGRRFIAAGDGDEAGRRMNAALMEGFAALGLSCTALPLPEGADVNTLLLRDRDALCERLFAAESEAEAAAEAPDSEYEGTSALGVLDDFFAAAARRAGLPGISTGLARLDDALGGGLYPGLVVLGAPSSLGKTSFVLQMADSIAQGGADVLYFSLEMSRYELMAKSISRITARLDDRLFRRAVPARELLRGAPPADLQQELLLRRARAEYAAFAGRVYIREGLADIGALEIRAAVAEHIARRGQRPVVFVDYLQILKATDQRATDKQNTDRAVVELKRISRDFDVPVVAISSFNREGYRTAAAMESFKESGAVEYSSDVLLALQLAGTGEAGFDANAAKLRDPRELELVMLKNRSGAPYAKLRLEYYARVGLFE